jgi:hypothetical protein
MRTKAQLAIHVSQLVGDKEHVLGPRGEFK